MTDIKQTPGFGPAGWDTGDRLQAGLEPDHSDDNQLCDCGHTASSHNYGACACGCRGYSAPRCANCGSLEPATRFVIERLDGKGPVECDGGFHGEGI